MKIKNIVMMIMLISFTPIAAMAMGQLHHSKQIDTKHDVYYCPMHLKILYDHPGTCPICGMNLIKKDSAAPAKKVGCGCCGMKHS